MHEMPSNIDATNTNITHPLADMTFPQNADTHIYIIHTRHTQLALHNIMQETAKRKRKYYKVCQENLSSKANSFLYNA